MNQTILITELKLNIEKLVNLKEKIENEFGQNHENVSLIEKSIEAMKTETLTKLFVNALKEAVKNRESYQDSFDAEEIIDFLENIFNKDWILSETDINISINNEENKDISERE